MTQTFTLEELLPRMRPFVQSWVEDLAHFNVKELGASGSKQSTTGTISLSTPTTLTLAAIIDFKVGHGIAITGAGAAGALLVSRITRINGLVVTIANAASTAVTAAAVNHDDTTAIQTAITAAAAYSATDLGAELYLPPTDYRISSTLVFPLNGYVSIMGAGRATRLVWQGGNSTTMLAYNEGSAAMQLSVEKFQLVNGNSATGLVGLRLGNDGGGEGLSNVSIRKILTDSCATGIEIWNESDEISITECWVFNYATAGIWMRTAVGCVSGCGNSNITLLSNHMQGGGAGSYGIRTDQSSGISLIQNVIQTATIGAKGIRLDGCRGYSALSNYFEITNAADASNGPFFDINSCIGGYIAANTSAGAGGGNLIDIDADTRGLQVGSNDHTTSGGNPSAAIAIAAGGDVVVLGPQIQIGSTWPEITGTPSLAIGLAGATTVASTLAVSGAIASPSSYVNIAAGATTTLFTLAAQTGYWVMANNEFDDYYAIAFVTRMTGNAIIHNIGNNNANLVLSVATNDLQAYNGTGATRTIRYRAIRTY